MAGYMEHCLAAYSPRPVDPDEITRCILNLDLLKGFDGEMEMDQRPGLASVHVPTLVLAGALDPITPPAAAEEIVAALPPGATYTVFEKSGHFIHDTEPDAFFSTLEAFVAVTADAD
jgi:proline iminopeptidase